MIVTPENILRHELIGLRLRVMQTRNKSIRGISGVVIDESKNMLTLSRGERKLLIPKTVGTFRFKLSNGCLVDVDGTRLVGRPESRLKTRVRRW